MLVSTRELHHLFDQLGLPSEPHDNDDFIRRHSLRDDERLAEACFFTEQQRQFLRESWKQDADWCIPMDQLDVLLRQPH